VPPARRVPRRDDRAASDSGSDSDEDSDGEVDHYSHRVSMVSRRKRTLGGP